MPSRVAAGKAGLQLAIAAPDPDTPGGFILWTPSQGPHGHQAAICESLGIVGLEQIEAAAEVGTSPSTQKSHAFWRESAGSLKPGDAFRTSFGVRLPGKRQHELHNCCLLLAQC